MYEVIDINNWRGKKHYLWFKKYPVHYYGFTTKMNITKFYNFIKKNNLPFFISFLYLVTKALNTIEEMRLRVVNDEVRLYDVIHPAYTVMTNSGVFDNCDNDYNNNFNEFLKNASYKIEKAKIGVNEDISYNDLERFDQFFITCIPWTNFEAMTHPMPNDATQTVPRICWGKYIKENDKVLISLNITVSHMLVDGYPLSKAFNTVQEYLDKVEEVIIL